MVLLLFNRNINRKARILSNNLLYIFKGDEPQSFRHLYKEYHFIGSVQGKKLIPWLISFNRWTWVTCRWTWSHTQKKPNFKMPSNQRMTTIGYINQLLDCICLLRIPYRVTHHCPLYTCGLVKWNKDRFLPYSPSFVYWLILHILFILP